MLRARSSARQVAAPLPWPVIEEQPAALAAVVRASETAGYAGSRIDLASLDATTRRLT
jgi:hypothetical protein